jgi:hypothetical protein
MSVPDETNAPDIPPLLVVGGTDTGKSHYGAQFLRRLQRRQGELQMVGTPSDLTAFQEVIDQLALGRSAPHTPSNVYREGTWLVRSQRTGQQSKILWPDYAGEQVEDILKRRQVSDAWLHRLGESRGWLLFVRPSAMQQREDILGRPRAAEFMSDGTATSTGALAPRADVTLADEVGLVELLQMLLFARQAHASRKGPPPSLVLLLSCWDEIASDTPLTPMEVMRSRLALLNQFVLANWPRERLDVLGLSALGKPLHDDVTDEEFVEQGPERHGWCVLEDGSRTPDLTVPVAQLMRHLER